MLNGSMNPGILISSLLLKRHLFQIGRCTTSYQDLVTVNISQEYQTVRLPDLPMLAQNWTISPNYTTYTFNLRQDVHFSDGTPLKAYNIWMMIYFCYYLSDNSSYWVDSYNIFNMSSVNFGNSTMSMINQTGGLVNPSPQVIALMSNQSWPIYVTNPYTIVFHLELRLFGF